MHERGTVDFSWKGFTYSFKFESYCFDDYTVNVYSNSGVAIYSILLVKQEID